MDIYYHDSVRVNEFLNIAEDDFRILIDFGSSEFDLEEFASLNECGMSCQWKDSMFLVNETINIFQKL